MLVFFLSTGKVGELMRHLMEQGGLAEDTPAAIVYRASWPDERILRGTVGDIARQAEEAGLGRQALVIVGRALGANGTASRLYDADFSHGYRNRLVSENFDGRCALYAFTDKGLTRAREIAAGWACPRCSTVRILPVRKASCIYRPKTSTAASPPTGRSSTRISSSARRGSPSAKPPHCCAARTLTPPCLPVRKAAAM